MAQLVAMDAAVAATRVPASAAVASTSASRHSVVSAGAGSVSWSFFLFRSVLVVFVLVSWEVCAERNFELSGLRCGCLVWLNGGFWRSCGTEDFERMSLLW